MIHELADVQTSKIGRGTFIWQFCVVLSGAEIGEDCNINSNVFIENDVVIGDFVTVKSGVQLWDGVRIESKAFIGPNVTFTNDLVPRSKVYPEKFERSVVKFGASIGANSTILAGNIIGDFSMIGAGSVITKNIPPFTIWYGNPAKHMGFITKDAVILDLNLTDKRGNKYILVNNEPILK